MAALVAMSGCLKRHPMCIRTDIVAAANGSQPVAVDLLLVRDKDLIKKLLAMPASQWFDQRAQFMRDYPDPKDLLVIHREWVPDQNIPCATIPLKPMPRATIIFANYFTKGDHRAHLKNAQSATIHLMQDDFQILPGPACTRGSCPEAGQ